MCVGGRRIAEARKAGGASVGGGEEGPWSRGHALVSLAGPAAWASWTGWTQKMAVFF